MWEWLKWKIAGKELTELWRWNSSWASHRRWFAEFDAAATVLDHLRCEAVGVQDPNNPMGSIMYERDELRKRVADNANERRSRN